ncbi:MAG: rhodanese-like domain-containing protein [Betaproteobacteria bacterium]
MIDRIEAAALKALIHAGGELALIDVREHGQYGESHLFYAVSVPYSRLELELPRLVPRRSVRLVLLDHAQALVAERAYDRMLAMGYQNLAMLDGGIEAWKAAGFELFAGVNVPSKAFGELAEEAFHTPHIGAAELQARLAAGESIHVIDGRPLAEHQKMHIPGARCCPNGELALRIDELVPDASTTIVVHCAGRTRSIIGAQTLIQLGLPNPIFALENGTQGWTLAGLKLAKGPDTQFAAIPRPEPKASRKAAAKAWSESLGISSIKPSELAVMRKDQSRSTMLCDVRTAEEFAQGHLAGAQHTPGGQLIQATDQFIGVRGARLVLYDSELLRAQVVACWLHLLGWEVYCLDLQGFDFESQHLAQIAIELGTGSQELATHAHDVDRASLSHCDFAIPAYPYMTSQALAATLASEQGKHCLLVDVRPSMSFRRAHLTGAIWSIRPRLTDLLEQLSTKPQNIILLAEDAGIGQLAALECDTWFAQRASPIDIRICTEAPAQWEASGMSIHQSPNQPPDDTCIDFLFFTHDRHDGNLDAARQYLAWELALTGQIDKHERSAFRL